MDRTIRAREDQLANHPSKRTGFDTLIWVLDKEVHKDQMHPVRLEEITDELHKDNEDLCSFIMDVDALGFDLGKIEDAETYMMMLYTLIENGAGSASENILVVIPVSGGKSVLQAAIIAGAIKDETEASVAIVDSEDPFLHFHNQGKMQVFDYVTDSNRVDLHLRDIVSGGHKGAYIITINSSGQS